jgi:hypothetical protein
MLDPDPSFLDGKGLTPRIPIGSVDRTSLTWETALSILHSLTISEVCISKLRSLVLQAPDLRHDFYDAFSFLAFHESDPFAPETQDILNDFSNFKARFEENFESENRNQKFKQFRKINKQFEIDLDSIIDDIDNISKGGSILQDVLNTLIECFFEESLDFDTFVEVLHYFTNHEDTLMAICHALVEEKYLLKGESSSEFIDDFQLCISEISSEFLDQYRKPLYWRREDKEA